MGFDARQEEDLEKRFARLDKWYRNYQIALNFAPMINTAGIFLYLSNKPVLHEIGYALAIVGSVWSFHSLTQKTGDIDYLKHQVRELEDKIKKGGLEKKND